MYLVLSPTGCCRLQRQRPKIHGNIKSIKMHSCKEISSFDLNTFVFQDCQILIHWTYLLSTLRIVKKSERVNKTLNGINILQLAINEINSLLDAKSAHLLDLLTKSLYSCLSIFPSRFLSTLLDLVIK